MAKKWEDYVKGFRSKTDEANDALRKFDPRSPDQKVRDGVIEAINGLKPFIERAREELEKSAGEDETDSEEPPKSS
jgi:hypothetical protein